MIRSIKNYAKNTHWILGWGGQSKLSQSNSAAYWLFGRLSNPRVFQSFIKLISFVKWV